MRLHAYFNDHVPYTFNVTSTATLTLAYYLSYRDHNFAHICNDDLHCWTTKSRITTQRNINISNHVDQHDPLHFSSHSNIHHSQRTNHNLSFAVGFRTSHPMPLCLH